MEETEKATLEFSDSETHLVYDFFFQPRIQGLSNPDGLSVIKNSFLWPTPKKHKNTSCIFMTLFIPVFLCGTRLYCLHGKLLFIPQSPVLCIASFSHSSKIESTQCQGFFQAMEIKRCSRHTYWSHSAYVLFRKPYSKQGGKLK